MNLATCIGCGCDDNHACVGEGLDSACSWVRLDREAGLGVCSACPGGDVSRWDAGGRTIRALESIAGNWRHFERVDIAPEAPEIQRKEMRRAFNAGVGSILLLWSQTVGRPNARAKLLELAEEQKQYLLRKKK